MMLPRWRSSGEAGQASETENGLALPLERGHPDGKSCSPRTSDIAGDLASLFVLCSMLPLLDGDVSMGCEETDCPLVMLAGRLSRLSAK
jgi:hypothetical protein